MATFCSWCGKRIGFTDISYTYETVGDREHFICGECSRKVAAAKEGTVTFAEIRQPETAPELFNYFTGEKKVTEEQQIKEAAQKTDPLYDDIHQIAQDLRFIKNYLIFCIVTGCIVGFFWLLSML